MKDKEVKKLSPFERLIYWIKIRHAIYRRKELGRPKPWCESKVMQTTYFTNVYRELDKTTKWFKDNVREPLRDKPEVLFATICFRWFNLNSTGAWLLLGDYFTEWDLKAVVSGLEYLRDERGQQIFTGAFNISNSGSTKPKINRVCEDYIQPVWEQRKELIIHFDAHHNMPGNELTLAEAHRELSKLPGLGGSGFMSAQIIADLRYTYLLDKAPDLLTWSSMGPGSKRGMNYLHSRAEETPISRTQWQEEMEELLDKVNNELREGSYKWPYIHAQNLQNCLCEYSKMCRILFGDGRSKRRYAGC